MYLLYKYCHTGNYHCVTNKANYKVNFIKKCIETNLDI